MTNILQNADIANIIIGYQNKVEIKYNKNNTSERYLMCTIAKINHIHMEREAIYNEQLNYFNDIINYIKNSFEDTTVTFQHLGDPTTFTSPGKALINVKGYSNGTISIRTDLYCYNKCKCKSMISRRYCTPGYIEIMGGIIDETVYDDDDGVRTYSNAYYLVQAIRNTPALLAFHNGRIQI
jgi:hypothetical protein